MRIIDLISRLQTLYHTYDDEYKSVMGEPEIVIDVFEKIGSTHTFEYVGFVPDIVIEKTDCGTYDILNAFYETKNTSPKAKKSFSEPWLFPKSGEA